MVRIVFSVHYILCSDLSGAPVRCKQAQLASIVRVRVEKIVIVIVRIVISVYTLPIVFKSIRSSCLIYVNKNNLHP